MIPQYEAVLHANSPWKHINIDVHIIKNSCKILEFFLALVSLNYPNDQYKF